MQFRDQVGGGDVYEGAGGEAEHVGKLWEVFLEVVGENCS